MGDELFTKQATVRNRCLFLRYSQPMKNDINWRLPFRSKQFIFAMLFVAVAIFIGLLFFTIHGYKLSVLAIMYASLSLLTLSIFAYRITRMISEFVRGDSEDSDSERLSTPSVLVDRFMNVSCFALITAAMLVMESFGALLYALHR